MVELMSVYKLKAGGQQTVTSGLFSFYEPRMIFTFLVGY